MSTSRAWSRCSGMCVACCVTMASYFSTWVILTSAGGVAVVALSILSDPAGVQSLVTLPAKHLKIIQSVIVFAEVFVVRVYGLIGLADLTAIACTFPRLALCR